MPYVDFVNGDAFDEMEELSESLFGKEWKDDGNMTRSEMIEFIKENHNVHIAHDLFDEDEYIYSDIDGLIWDEHGYLFEDWSSVTDRWSGVNGIRMRTGGKWETGWHIKE